MEASARPSRKSQEHDKRRAFNSTPIHLRCSRESRDCTAETFVDCSDSANLGPNITVKMGSTRDRPRPHAAILRHPYAAARSEPHNTIYDLCSSQQQILSLRQHLCDIRANPASRSGTSIKTNLPLAHHHRFGCCWLPALSAIPALSLYRRR